MMMMMMMMTTHYEQQTGIRVNDVDAARKHRDVARHCSQVVDGRVYLDAGHAVDVEIVIFSVLLRRSRLDVRQTDVAFLRVDTHIVAALLGLCFVTCFNYNNNSLLWPVVSDGLLTVPYDPLVHVHCLLCHTVFMCIFK